MLWLAPRPADDAINPQRHTAEGEGLKVCGLADGGRWIRTSSTAVREPRIFRRTQLDHSDIRIAQCDAIRMRPTKAERVCMDSLLEGDGFEPSVPRDMTKVSKPSRFAAAALEVRTRLRKTDSNGWSLVKRDGVFRDHPDRPLAPSPPPASPFSPVPAAQSLRRRYGGPTPGTRGVKAAPRCLLAAHFKRAARYRK